MAEQGKPTVLIVDDVPTNIKTLGAGLQDEFNIIAATSGEECLARAARQPFPDLILLDIEMPEPDGFEVCRRLKADERICEIPVIFVTAKDARVDEEAGLGIGAVDYITKPYSLPIVKARIRVHLELRQHRAFLEEALQKRTKDLKRAQLELLTRIRRGA